MVAMEEEISKSQKKREAQALQKIGVELIEFSPEKLALLPLNDNLLKAIVDAKSIKSHGAKRRQAQLIGKLMRASDYEAILAAYDNIREQEASITASFQEVEEWRDRLINQGKDALTEFITAYQVQEVQQLRHTIQKAIDDKLQQKNTGGAKALFRYLRSIIK